MRLQIVSYAAVGQQVAGQVIQVGSICCESVKKIWLSFKGRLRPKIDTPKPFTSPESASGNVPDQGGRRQGLSVLALCLQGGLRGRKRDAPTSAVAGEFTSSPRSTRSNSHPAPCFVLYTKYSCLLQLVD